MGEIWVKMLRKQKQLMVPIIPAWLPWLAEKCETRFLVPQGGTTGGGGSLVAMLQADLVAAGDDRLVMRRDL